MQGEIGECCIADKALISSIGLHQGEEYALSGTLGSGTIFLSGCNLHCVFCQNWEISQTADGQAASASDLAAAMLNLQKAGAHNINWVSPTHVVPMLLDGLRMAYENGLSIPLVYNTGGYDSAETVSLLDGIVDIYMPDMKYGDSATAKRLSTIDNYVEQNRAAVQEMYRQVGPLQCNEAGIAYRGLLVRHLVLPGNAANSDAILDFLDEALPGPVDINIMDQYRPCYHADTVPNLQRCITELEYQAVVNSAKRKETLRVID
jgi:putative pyruvate formate lyase activating enzyme